MEIKTLTSLNDRLGVHLCGDKAVLVQGLPLTVAKVKNGFILCEGDKGIAKEILKSLGIDNYKFYTSEVKR